jgi:hypothetical protein
VSIVNAQTNIEVLVVGGGGSGGYGRNQLGGGGGGAGGVVFSNLYPIASGNYTVTVGNGGSPVSGIIWNTPYKGQDGQNSVFGTLTAFGGGGGGGDESQIGIMLNGGSGGGSTNGTNSSGQSTQTSQLNETFHYGNAGGTAAFLSHPGYPAAGGGGAGGNGFSPNKYGYGNYGGDGGAGVIINFSSGSPSNYFAAGGGGSGGSDFGPLTQNGGMGGSSIGGNGNGTNLSLATAGLINTGSGGGGSTINPSGAGGSGIVIIQYLGTRALYSGGIISFANGYVIHTFTSSGNFLVPPPTINISAPTGTLTSNCSGVSSTPTTFGVNGSGLTTPVIIFFEYRFTTFGGASTISTGSLSLLFSSRSQNLFFLFLFFPFLSRLKPVSKLKKSGYLNLSVVGYGGGLWHTW